MTTPETRYPCPVCLGVKMEKVILTLEQPRRSAEEAGPAVGRPGIHESRTVPTPGVRDDTLVLDHCSRCGGVWFEAGEVQRLRRGEAELLWRAIVRREAPYVMLCHSCRSPVARQEPACGVCGWVVELECPACARPLDRSREGELTLDHCRHCRGVWFDHEELAGIWRLEMGAAVARRRGAGEGGDPMLLDALYYDPFLMYYGVQAGVHVAGAAAQGLAHAAGSGGAIGEVAGAAGEAAAGVFETIVEIISGLFS